MKLMQNMSKSNVDDLDEVSLEDVSVEMLECRQEIDETLSMLSTATETEELLAKKDNISNEELELIHMYTGYELSTEESDVTIYKKRLEEIQKQLLSNVSKQIKKFAPLVNKVGVYNNAKLQSLKDEILTNDLVPRKSLDVKRVNAFISKYSCYFATGHTLAGSSNDLGVFANKINGFASPNGLYIKGILNTKDQMKDYKGPSSVSKMQGDLNIKFKLVNCSLINTGRIVFSDYRLSLMDNWMNSTVSLVTVKFHNKLGLKVGKERYEFVPTGFTISTAKTADALKNLDIFIKNGKTVGNAKSGLNKTIKNFVNGRMTALLDVDNQNKFMEVKYSELIINNLINIYSNVHTVDRILIDYISLTFEKNKNK